MRALPLRTCKYIREDGTPCRSAPMKNEPYCFWHSPAHAEEAEEARRLGGLRRRRERTVAGAYEFEGLQTGADSRRLLEIAALDTLALENGVARNRVLVNVAVAHSKCVETAELERRIQMLEAARTVSEAPGPPVYDVDLEAAEDLDGPRELVP